MMSRNRIGLRAPAWFSFPKPNPGAELRLFCFPYAGSGGNVFHKWSCSLPACVELCLVHLPGRDQRIREKPFDRLAPLLDSLERNLLPYFDKPPAFFGHSMGGLMSFEVARLLRSRYGVTPAHLFISGCNSPRQARLSPKIHRMPEGEFLSELKRLKGMADPMPLNAKIIKSRLSALVADFNLFDDYSYKDGPPLDCPISVYGGFDDHYVDYSHLESWREHTTGSFALRLFGGDHFFIHTAETLVLKALSQELEALAHAVH